MKISPATVRQPLDPWDDASLIAERILAPGGRLIVVIGAEAWCEKCRKLRPHFDELARLARDPDTILWLDLEEHQEFLGQYIPESLPEVLIYSNKRLVSRSLLPDGERESLIEALRKRPARSFENIGEDPGIAQRLTQQDWA